MASWLINALVPRSSGPGSSPGRGHCVVFLGKTLHSHSASLRPGLHQCRKFHSVNFSKHKWVTANCWGNLTNCGE